MIQKVAGSYSSRRAALLAEAADWLQVHIKVFGAVVIGKLFTRLYIFLGEDIDSFILNIYLAVWPAGVIDKARLVLFDVAVNHRVVAGPEEIFTCIRFLFCGGCRPAGVFNNAGISRDSLFGEHAETRARSPDA